MPTLRSALKGTSPARPRPPGPQASTARLQSAVVERGEACGHLAGRAAAEGVGDAERDHVVTLLRGHCTAGRLSLDELSERVGAALAARTRGELEATLADLPGSTFWECLGIYRDELDDPGFASGLVEEGGGTDEAGNRLARLHSLAAERFEQRATRFAAKAERVDAYERGAYGEPPVNGVMLTILMTTTLGFSIVVVLRMGLIGGMILAVSLGLNALFVRMWRRPSYQYEAEYRKPWDEAASLARDRADQARKASIFARAAPC
jgi:hypothetical protein